MASQLDNHDDGFLDEHKHTPYRLSRDPLDQSALLLYQAEQRKLWHQAINSPGYGYNLSLINEDLLHQTKERLYWMEREWKDITFENNYIVSTSDSSKSILLMICDLFFHYVHYQMCSTTYIECMLSMPSQMLSKKLSLCALILHQSCCGL